MKSEITNRKFLLARAFLALIAIFCFSSAANAYAACTYTVTPTNHVFPAAGGQVVVTVTTSIGCIWQANANNNWIGVSATIGFGSGVMVLSVPPSVGPARNGSATVAGKTVTIGQYNGCTYSLSPASKDFDDTGGTGNINVTASSAACPRNGASNVSWITVTGGQNSTGSGPLNYSVAPNNGPARSGSIILGNDSVTINQSNGCDYSISPGSVTINSGNTSGSVTVTTSAGCPITANSLVPWVHVSSIANGKVNYTIDANNGPARDGIISIKFNSFAIHQESGCGYSLSSSSQNFGSGSGSSSFSVTVTDGFCPWNPVSSDNWLKVTNPGSKTGNGLVSFTLDPNLGANRTAKITVGNKIFTVNQQGANNNAPAIVALNPGFASKGGKPFMMNIAGANFTSDCKVRWNGNYRQTTFISAGLLQAAISSDDIKAEGEGKVTVYNTQVSLESNEKMLMIYGAVANVSSASFTGEELAPSSLVSAFGVDLATDLKIADKSPLPTELLGTTVTIKDANGTEHKASLFFVSAGQVNYLMPDGVALGKASVMIKSGSDHLSAATVEIKQVAPALFTANSSGKGIATAQALRIKQNGQQIYEPVAEFNAGQNAFVGKPIDLTVPGEQVYLILYGTGFRYRSSLGAVTVEIGGVTMNTLYAGLSPGFDGLDQINLVLPNNLAGRGEVDVVVTVDGKKANTVKLMFK